jgi:hypothetical protein
MQSDGHVANAASRHIEENMAGSEGQVDCTTPNLQVIAYQPPFADNPFAARQKLINIETAPIPPESGAAGL